VSKYPPVAREYTHHHLSLQCRQLSLHCILLLGAHARHERLIHFALVRDCVGRFVHKLLDALKGDFGLKLLEHCCALFQPVHDRCLDLGKLDCGDLGRC
jgi:hypothetical protein